MIILNISIAFLVDGGLSEWSEWGRCDQLCEPGKQRRHKTCTNPKRRCGGKHCDPKVATTEEKPCFCPGKHFYKKCLVALLTHANVHTAYKTASIKLKPILILLLFESREMNSDFPCRPHFDCA